MAFIEPLHTHSPLAVFGRQTMRNDSKWKCTTCSPIRPLSSKPNICVFLSVCTRLGVKSSEKKAPAYENVWEWLKAASLVCKATVTNRRSFYCIYVHGLRWRTTWTLGTGFLLYTDIPFWCEIGSAVGTTLHSVSVDSPGQNSHVMCAHVQTFGPYIHNTCFTLTKIIL